MALRYISRKSRADARASAREIADAYGLPFEITAKTLQRLKDLGLIASVQGARGGYTLQRSMSEVTLAQFLEMMEGPQFLVTCTAELGTAGEEGCEYRPRCDIQHALGDLNSRILGFFTGIRLSELTDGDAPAAAFARLLPSFQTSGQPSTALGGWEEP